MESFLQKISEEFVTPFHNLVLVFATLLFIILFAPLLLRKLRIPGIIGLIISGVAIGPHGFNLIERSSAVNLFAIIGLLYIMFIAGLELDLREFAKNRYKSFLFGFLTFVIPWGLGFLVCMHLLKFEAPTSLLVSSMFATHTLVAYPITSRLGISKNEAVAITVGGTIITDTAVLLLLAVITGQVRSGNSSELWLRLGISFLVFLVVMTFAVPRISRWFFRRMEEEKNSQYIYVLAVVFFSAFLAEMAGLEPIIGAFAAGLALNNIIPNNSPLMQRIEFVGHSLFIPFFLISVGMVVDLRVFTSSPEALVVAGVLTAFAISSKWLAAWLTGTILRYTKAQRNLIFGLSSAHAAATLAVIYVGNDIGLVNETILNGTIILILITCLVATLATDQAAKKVALQAANNPENEDDRGGGERILVPIANPGTMERLLDLANILRAPRSILPIYALSIVEDNENAQALLNQSRRTLGLAQQYVTGFGGQLKGISTIDQNISTGIRRVAREVGATDVVMGSTEKTNLTDLFFGKMLEQVVDSSSEAIWIFHSTMALNLHKRLHIVCPPYSEKEPGFVAWLTKAARLAAAMNLRVMIHSTSDTYRIILAVTSHLKQHFPADFNHFDRWDDFPSLSKELSSGSLILLVAPRKGTVSHIPGVETAIRKLAKQFNHYSYIVLYPESRVSDGLLEYAGDFDPTLVEIGLSRMRRSASGIGRIFRRKRR